MKYTRGNSVVQFPFDSPARARFWFTFTPATPFAVRISAMGNAEECNEWRFFAEPRLVTGIVSVALAAHAKLWTFLNVVHSSERRGLVVLFEAAGKGLANVGFVNEFCQGKRAISCLNDVTCALVRN